MTPLEHQISGIRDLVPEAVSESGLDFEVLRRALTGGEDTGPERFGLSWPGKAESLRAMQEPSVGSLAPMPSKSVKWAETGNVLVEGDNLEVLKLLQRSYHGAVKLIYIDPPYNTGKEFIYPDNFREGLQDYLRYSGQADSDGSRLVANADARGRYHSNWLSMMLPRLSLSRNLLRPDGAIFVTIDDNEVHHLRSLMSEVFGEENFVANIVWQKKYAVSNDDPGIAPMHDHILVYQKSSQFERRLLPRTEKQNSRYTNPDNDPRGPWASDNYVSNKSRDERPTLWYSIVHPRSGEEVWPDESAVWRYSKEKHLELAAEDRLFWGPDQSYAKPRLKRFLSEIRDGLVPSTWWPFAEVGHNDEAQKETARLIGSKVFSTPKPVRLLRRIVELASSDDDLVLDFFAGSGATGEAVMRQNIEDGGRRQFILVQLPEPVDHDDYDTIADITRSRLERAGEEIAQDGAEVDVGFRYFALGPSNFHVWDSDPPENLGEVVSLFTDGTTESATSEGLACELLLKAGFRLTEPIEDLVVEGLPVKSVADGQLLIVCDQTLTLEAVEEMVEMAPSLILVLDRCFADNDQLKVNTMQTIRAANQGSGPSITLKVV